jgi:hypothetical protein
MVTGCEDDDDDGGNAGPAQVAGRWSLTQSFSTGRVVTFAMTLVQNGGALTGSSSYGPVNGAISGSSISFTIRDEDMKTFTGTVSGDSMNGTFTENFEDELFRNGSWTAARTGP